MTIRSVIGHIAKVHNLTQEEAVRVFEQRRNILEAGRRVVLPGMKYKIKLERYRLHPAKKSSKKGSVPGFGTAKRLPQSDLVETISKKMKISTVEAISLLDNHREDFFAGRPLVIDGVGKIDAVIKRPYSYTVAITKGEVAKLDPDDPTDYGGAQARAK